MPGLEDLYREIILDHYRNPRNRGELESPPAVRTEGFNPLCGDEVVIYLDVDDGVIADMKVCGPGLLDLAVVGLDDVAGRKGQDPRPGPLDDQGVPGHDVAPRPTVGRAWER